MGGYGPRAICKKINIQALEDAAFAATGSRTIVSTTSYTFNVYVPASFFVTAVYWRTGTTWAAATSVTSINLSAGVASLAATPVAVDTASLMAIADVKTAGYPTIATATVDAAGLRENGIGFLDNDAGANLHITVTPTFSGAFSAGETDLIVMGFQVPYPV